jgi:hypothetical protein
LLVSQKELYPRGYSVKALDLSKSLAVEDLMAAGQLGGPLYPTYKMTDSARELAINSSFGEAIQSWNKHEYKVAIELFRNHVTKYPDGPWASEAMLHIGCDALFNGRYSEADNCFQWILQSNQGNSYLGVQMMVNKARLRLSNLKALQGNFPEAMEHLRIVKQSSPSWRDRTYAAHWIQRLSREAHEQAAILNCGVQALAHLLEKGGKKAEAEKVRGMLASSPRGQNMKELKSIAARHGYHLTGLRLSVSQLKEIPLPAIVQLTGLNSGDRGHYWVLEERTKNTLKFSTPRGIQTAFSREWGGNALVFARKKHLPGIRLAAKEMEGLYGGCCGHPRPESDLGDPGGPEPDEPCGDSCGPNPGCGSPHWSVNKVNLNFFVRDVPLWYRSPIGPPVEIALSYNAQSAIATFEPFGNKWQFNYGTYLVEDSGGLVTVSCRRPPRCLHS